MNIQEILNDWNNGLTHGQILAKYNITREQGFAIAVGGENLSVKEIEVRIKTIRPNMKSNEILSIMRMSNE